MSKTIQENQRIVRLLAASARATTYGIAFKPGKGSLVAAKGATPDDYGDPVNFKFSLTPETRLQEAVSLFNQDGQREAGGYSTSEWAIVGRRIAHKAGMGLHDGKIVEGVAAGKASDINEIGWAITAILDRATSPGEDDELGSSWYIHSIFADGRAWVRNFHDETSAGDMRRTALEVDWEEADGLVKITAIRPGYLKTQFVPLKMEKSAPAVIEPIDRSMEELADTLHFKPSPRFRDVLDGAATSAVLNSTDRETGAPRWITVSSGTWPDRMGEIVAKHAQEYALLWATKTKHYGPLRLAHIPNHVQPGSDLRARWRALVGDYVEVFDAGLLPMVEQSFVKALEAFRSPSETRVRNLTRIVGKDLAIEIIRGNASADVGTCDYQTLQGGSNPGYPGCFLVESGLWDEAPVARKARDYFDHNPGEVSIGFLFDHMSLVVGKDGTAVYPSYDRRMWRFERSLLPMGTAAFPASYLEGSQGIATI